MPLFICLEYPGEVIAETIVSTLQVLGVDIENVRGQGYDGAANMSSDNVGVLASNKRALAKGCICTLQWSLPESGNLPQIRNVIDKLKRCCLYFLGSPKREGKADYIFTCH